MVLERSYRRRLRGHRMSWNDAPECAKEGEQCERERCGTSMCRTLPGALRVAENHHRWPRSASPSQESLIALGCSMEAREWRGQRGGKSGRVPAMLCIK